MLLAILAYLPALTAAPGQMPSDSKLYLYLNPGRFVGDALSTFDPRQFAGWVPHQHVSYIWPAGPWFWLFDAVGVPDWVAHRLWIGTLMLAAGLGVRWCARLLGLGSLAAVTAAVLYQFSPYVLPYVSRTSVMLLPWAGLGWIVAFTIRATRRQSWGDPAAIALVVLTVGSVNATALAMIVPGPTLWLLHATWQRTIAWRSAAIVVVRTGVLSIGVSLWWIVMLSIQGRYGADVLPYSESLADVSLTATSAEVWRGLGYWLFYIRDPYAATTTESLRYLSSTPSIAVSYLVPIVCLAGLVFVRWAHRRFAAMLVACGALLAIGVHPITDKPPLMRILAGDDESGLALALRSSTRALPVMVLGLALTAGSLVMSLDNVRVRRPRIRRAQLRADFVTAGLIGLLAVANLPSLWNGAFVDPALERDQAPPQAWLDAAAALDRTGTDGRVLQLPGAEFGAFRWGYTVDQPLPGLTDKPLVTRDLLPLGSPGAMDLLFALDDRLQDGVLEPSAVAPTARLLGVDTIWLANDIAFDRFRTARPEIVSDQIANAPGIGTRDSYGELFLNRADIATTDERALGDPRVGGPVVPVELFALDSPGSVVRVADTSVVVSGSGDGIVDLAAAGLLDGTELIQYSASLAADSLEDAVAQAAAVLITDSNRDRARHWRSSQDTTGYTEPGGSQQDVLRPISSDQRLPVFDDDDPLTQTIAVQRGPVTATATSYGEPFAYLPEHRPSMAIDGDPRTAWSVGEHANPVGETIRLALTESIDSLVVRQPATSADARRISEIEIAGQLIVLDERSLAADGQLIELGPTSGALDITIAAISTPVPGSPRALAGVGFAELSTALGSTIEVVRPPQDALPAITPDTPLAVSFSRLRTDPMDRWRDDPEQRLVRELELPSARTMTIDATVRIDARASDEELAGIFGWPAIATTRLTGAPRHAGIAALDGDHETSWITGFGEALGAVLRVSGATQPIDSMSIQQPITGFSRVTRVAIRTNAEQRMVELVPDAGGTSTVTFDPPLAAGELEIEIAAVEPATTIDRRFGDLVELPSSIVEITFPGRPTVAPVEASEVEIACAPLLSIDGSPLHVTLRIPNGDWLAGAPIGADMCDPTVELATGPHLILGEPSELPVTIDRVVLRDRVAGRDGAVELIGRSADRPTVTILEASSKSRSVEISGCSSGCWLVFGEGYNDAWAASGPTGSLGPPVMVDGGFNGWRIDATDSSVIIDVEWTQQRKLNLALIASLATALIAAALIVADRRRSYAGTDDRVVSLTPTLISGSFGSLSRRRARFLCITWIGAAGLLIGPLWAVWGAAGGLVVVATRRSRLPELAAIASLCVVAAIVVLIEFRESTLPNGAWPLRFESIHGVGVFAVVSLIVGALSATDADSDSGV